MYYSTEVTEVGASPKAQSSLDDDDATVPNRQSAAAQFLHPPTTNPKTTAVPTTIWKTHKDSPHVSHESTPIQLPCAIGECNRTKQTNCATIFNYVQHRYSHVGIGVNGSEAVYSKMLGVRSDRAKNYGM